MLGFQKSWLSGKHNWFVQATLENVPITCIITPHMVKRSPWTHCNYRMIRFVCERVKPLANVHFIPLPFLQQKQKLCNIHERICRLVVPESVNMDQIAKWNHVCIRAGTIFQYSLAWYDMISIPSVQLSIYRYLTKLIKCTLTITATSVPSERLQFCWWSYFGEKILPKA